MSRWVDIGFGLFALLVAAGALALIREGFPAAVAAGLGMVGLAVLARGILEEHLVRPTLTILQLVAAALCVALAHLGWQFLPLPFALHFGPPEFTALILLQLAVVVALGVSSRLRALGMVLIGLLLGAIGTDLETGAERFTFGLLADGIPMLIAALGVLVVADAVLFLASPSTALRLYARHVQGWVAPRVSWLIDVPLRLIAVAALALAGITAFQFGNAWSDVWVMAAFGLVGLFARVLGLNRLALLLAMSFGVLLEENIRRSLTLSRGNYEIFSARPISASLLLAAGVIVCVAVFLSIRRRRARASTAQSGSQLKMSAERSSS